METNKCCILDIQCAPLRLCYIRGLSRSLRIVNETNFHDLDLSRVSYVHTCLWERVRSSNFARPFHNVVKVDCLKTRSSSWLLNTQKIVTRDWRHNEMTHMEIRQWITSASSVLKRDPLTCLIKQACAWHTTSDCVRLTMCMSLLCKRHVPSLAGEEEEF